MFLNAPVKSKDFFVNGLPCECAGLHPGPAGLMNVSVNDLSVLAKYFNFRKQFKANIWNWLRLRYGIVLLKTLYMLPCYWCINGCRGLHSPHTAASYLKSTFIEVWEKESKYLKKICNHRFRDKSDVNQWLMEWWQVMAGKFYPRGSKFSRMYKTFNNELLYDIRHKKHKLICINYLPPEKIDIVCRAYDEVLPEKSAFEL
ncbi:MAG: stealth conserved region 3 domain-containing protein [Synergistaceae bacterium]|nr:stealth conserved region 3 domain-containing protein [Synergistaceae bacterium]